MEDTYRYPVFFECHSLRREQLKKIERYFCIRRRSGGGDCGPVRRVNNTTYSVEFNHERDQQAVLQRSEHVVELADGPLVFTVHSRLEPGASSPSTPSAASQDLTAAAQSPQSIPASTPPPNGEEYELQLDFYLVRYLKECPKAGRELKEKMASVACSAQFYPDEERVLVKTIPGAVDEERNWKAEVKKLFDGYLCHYEFDPHTVKALLQSCSSHQTTDEVKVYSEVGMVVVVGKCSQVKARLKDVKDRSGLIKKDTCTLHLGKAKLRLLCKEIENSLGRDFPGVKVMQGDAGQLFLEGSGDELVKAGDWISDQEKLVFEKTVSDMNPHVLTFLKKAYGGPGELRDFLQVGDEVEVELGDTELRFFTLSTDSFDDIENALRDVIKEATINVPNSSAVPSELMEKLKSMTNEMNQRQYRAQVVFGSDSTVCLVGHRKEVGELIDAVAQFILDQSYVESIIPLPSPQLAQDLPETLQLHGFECSGVTLHVLTSSSEPMVVLEGPCSKVTEVKKRLTLFLDSLIEDRVVIDLPGASRYFKSPFGRDDTLNISYPQKCLAHLEEQPYTSRDNLAFDAKLSKGCRIVASYDLCDGLQVQVCQGDITKLEADALVNAANEDLDHCGGVAAALSKAGGPEVQSESNALVKTGKIPTGDVVVTTGGNLKCKKLLHAVGPVHGKVGGRKRILIEKTIQSALNLAEMMALKSIAMPCISSGVFGVPVNVCSEAIAAAVKGFGSQGERSLSRIILIDNRGEVVRAMQGACDRLLQRISTGNTAPSELGLSMDAAAQDTARGATAGDPGDGVHVEIIQGTIETQQVDALVSPMVGHEPLSTCVGNTLSKMAGRQLTAGFRRAAGEETLPGDTVLVDGLTGLPANAVFFLNLCPWDDDLNGTAVQVLRLGIKTMLGSCENRGFRSVALPLVGAGIALCFPESVVARVILEEVQEFEQSRTSRTPFLVRIVIHPKDKETNEVIKCVEEAFQAERFTKSVHQPDQVLLAKRIILLGKTGSGKSSLANTMFGEKVFETNYSANSCTSKCQVETKSVNGRSITLIDTPGFFDTDQSEEELKPEILRSITECAPGPHAFLIVLKVERFTEHEQAVITEICEYFSDDALKYAVIVFTHGDQLPKGVGIEEFVGQNKNLSDLLKRCGGRYHVVDNKYWKNNEEDNYRSNQFQVAELLNTIDKMTEANKGCCFTSKILQEVKGEIQAEEERIRLSPGNMSQEEIRNKAKLSVFDKLLIRSAGIATAALLGALLGVTEVVLGQTLKGQGATSPVVGVLRGLTQLQIGYDAAEGAESPQEAMVKAAQAVWKKSNI